MATLDKIVKSGVKLTPMMQQYYDIKVNYRDTIVFFRMGDFYEVFFEDAQECSKILNITLTHRGKLGETPIPMAGMPHHAAAAYIDRITTHGYKVAICEQVEDPKATKGIVKRAVIQVVSPGLPYDLEKADATEHKYIASGIFHEGHYYLMALDFTTGAFSGHKLDTEEDFIEKLRLFAPKEFITYMGQWDHSDTLTTLLEQTGIMSTHLSAEYFEEKYTEIYIEKLIPGYKRDKIIGLQPIVLGPIGALAYYICSTQDTEQFYHIRPFQMINEKGQMKVTLPTLTGLEILPKSRETYKDSLIGFLDKTRTSMGSRQLRNFFLSPIADEAIIKERLDLIEYFQNEPTLLEDIREDLSNVRDLERILAKISTGKATPGDIINISIATKTYKSLKTKLKNIPGNVLEDFKKKEFSILTEISKTIDDSINDEIGASLDKGNLIKEGCNKKRDKLANLSTNTAEELLKLETRYREETGIAKLKVKSNNVAGYFIEISKLHSDKVPKSFDRRQTLVNSERYTTDELSQFEKEILSSKEKLERLEREIFKDIIDTIGAESNLVQKLANIISRLDVFQSFSWVSFQEGFTRPEIVAKKHFEIQGAWHPLIKSIIKDQFVPHDLILNKNKFFGLITGPNMAGKTTVMREVAIIQLLTQVGSFVPARHAKVSLCDYLFSRLGASDDILKGQSTFMVEMAETAEILRHATERSLIILDEVGRGTSTYDGLSIAWALVEHFVKKTKALTLFATHYHELIDLIDKEACAKNLTVETLNQNGDVQFLYRLIEEGASQSYGIYVAKLAGLPKSILSRSQNILKSLEKEEVESKSIEIPIANMDPTAGQLSFFTEESEAMPIVPEYLQEIESEIDDMDIMNMTPIQAMLKLQEFKQQIKDIQ
jgi:DNA mismatch repair protein MutS